MLMPEDQIRNRDFSSEFQFQASRSGGPGGQHVNTSSTKVELRFDVDGSSLLTDDEKERIKNKLPNRINNENILIISSQQSRSQHANRERTVEKFYKLINAALQPEKKRKPTRPSKAAKEKRLQKKKKISDKKEARKKPGAG